MAVPTLLGLNSPATRERYVRDILEATYGDEEFELAAVDRLLQSETDLPTWVRTMSDFWVELGLHRLLPGQANRSCRKCHRAENDPASTACKACKAPLKPWPGRDRYLAEATKYRRLKTKRQCANVRRSMERHGLLQLQPSGRHYRIQHTPTPEQQAAFHQAIERASPGKVSTEILGYHLMDHIMGMLPMMARYSIETGRPMMEPFDDLDPKVVLHRIQTQAKRWRDKAVAEGTVPQELIDRSERRTKKMTSVRPRA